MLSRGSLFLILLGLISESAFAELVEPKIKIENGVYQLSIGKDALQALKKFDPNFQIWTEDAFMPSAKKYYKSSIKQTLAGVVGDFNGDKIPDVVLSGHNMSRPRYPTTVSSHILDDT